MEGFNGNFDGFGNAKEMAQKFREQKNKMSGKKKTAIIALLVIMLVFIFAGRILNLVMDIWQVHEIGAGFTDIFWKNFFCRLAVSLSGFLIVFIASVVNLFVLRRLAFIKHTNVRFFEKKWPYLIFSVVL